jgi:hypothetical protein
MSRRPLRHRAERVDLRVHELDRQLACAGELTVVVVLEGDATSRQDDGTEMLLARGDVVTLGHGDSTRLRSASASRGVSLLLVDVFRD